MLSFLLYIFIFLIQNGIINVYVKIGELRYDAKRKKII